MENVNIDESFMSCYEAWEVASTATMIFKCERLIAYKLIQSSMN